jgi:hypothetical protein
VLVAVGLCLMPPLAFAARQSRKVRCPPRQTTRVPSPVPTPHPSPPVVDFQALTDRENAERGERINIRMFVSNKSPVGLSGLELKVVDADFEIVEPPAFTTPLAPFGDQTASAVIKASDNAAYSAHKVLLTIKYNWTVGGVQFVSEQPATASILVKRRFEEETKGFPGGTAAFFYLLLPIIPFILSYQFVEGLRKGEGPKFPTFSADYIVPAFFAGVVLSLLMLVAFRQGDGLDYSNPVTFMLVLFGSLGLGALIPAGKWIHNLRQNRLWAFSNSETLESYLRKALLAPKTPREFEWATGQVDKEQWEGILLRQPNGAPVLGAKLRVIFPRASGEEAWAQFLKEVVSEEGLLIDRHRLVEMVEARAVRLEIERAITQSKNPIPHVVVFDEVKKWKRAGGKTSPPIVPTR